MDLPGYGYASISKSMREKWTKMIRDYLLLRENLQVVFVLVDSRLEPQKIDLDFINSLGEDGVPFAIIFTKTDKLSANKVQGNVQRFKNKLAESWEEMPFMMLSSAETGKGREDILSFIEQINNQYQSSNNPIPNET